MVQLFFLQEYMVHLLRLGLNNKSCQYTRVLHRKIGHSVLCVIILVVRDFRKVPSLMIHLDIETRSNYWFDFFRQFLNQKFDICRGGFDKKTIRFHQIVKFLIVQNFQKKPII